MLAAICQLDLEDLRQLAGALRSCRLQPPFSAVALRRFLPERYAADVARELQERIDRGQNAHHMADWLELLVEDRSHRRSELIDLVWTGPEARGIASRDTGVVVRELFHNATDSVLLAGYAIYRGDLVFRALADRMDQRPELNVTMYLDVKRSHGDPASESELVRRFAERFRTHDWPGQRLPDVYFDPRSLDPDPSRRASLHAKCVVIDQAQAFVSSANFTQAAQLRNIEVGVLIRSRGLAEHLSTHFRALAMEGILQRVPLGCS